MFRVGGGGVKFSKSRKKVGGGVFLKYKKGGAKLLETVVATLV